MRQRSTRSEASPDSSGSRCLASICRYGRCLSRGAAGGVRRRRRGVPRWRPHGPYGPMTAVVGVQQPLLGTTKRTDGAIQVTYGRHPLYYYAHEGKNEMKCHNIEGLGELWLVVPLPVTQPRCEKWGSDAVNVDEVLADHGAAGREFSADVVRSLALYRGRRTRRRSSACTAYRPLLSSTMLCNFRARAGSGSPGGP
jgi:hypothetical protein